MSPDAGTLFAKPWHRRSNRLSDSPAAQVMEGLHEIPRPEWAARYASELLRRGSCDSFEDLVKAGLRLWLTAGRQVPESVALLHWRSRAGADAYVPG